MEIISKDTQPADPGGWTEALGEHGSNPPTPRTSGDVIIALGKEWRVSSCENRIKAQFEQWVRRNAKLAIAEEDQENPDEGSRLRSIYIGDFGAGHYRWDGRHVRQARTDVPGLKQLLFLLLRRCHPDITEEVSNQIFEASPREVGLAFRWSLGNSSSLGDKTTPGANRIPGTVIDLTPQQVPSPEEMQKLMEKMLADMKKQMEQQMTKPDPVPA